MPHQSNQLIFKKEDIKPFLKYTDDPHHQEITWGLHPDGTIYINYNEHKTWNRMNKCHITKERIIALYNLIN